MLKQSGIDIRKYGPGSTRAASVNKSASPGVNIDIILKSGGWQREVGKVCLSLKGFAIR